jgi:ABC-2 type transport system ATP-binding protein
LLRDTPILLFDEPTVGLDPKSAAAFRKMLHERLVREEGKTILFSSHNLSEAQEMADRIAILNQGRVTALGAPDDIRYEKFNKKVFKISFREAVFEKKVEKMLHELRETPGVFDVDLEISPDRSLHGLSLSVDRDLDLSKILEVTLKSGLKKKAINTLEPSLEEAFIAITSQSTKRDGS